MAERRTPSPSWTDERLVKACLGGQEEAWNALVDKYKNLVYSVILKYRTTQEEAADIFQSVWLEAYNDLGKLRKHDSFKSWLLKMTSNNCYHWKKKKQLQENREGHDLGPEDLEESLAVAPTILEELERDQLVREAIHTLPDRCREMVQLLFFTHPQPPYKEVAEKLGLAVGSIGFIRGRCLKKLQKALEDQGF